MITNLMGGVQASPSGGDEPFRLELIPAELWGVERVCQECGGISPSMVWSLVRAGKLPRPWKHGRKRRSLFAPEQVAPAAARYRHYTGR
jgi:hypothetical protein